MNFKTDKLYKIVFGRRSSLSLVSRDRSLRNCTKFKPLPLLEHNHAPQHYIPGQKVLIKIVLTNGNTIWHAAILSWQCFNRKTNIWSFIPRKFEFGFNLLPILLSTSLAGPVTQCAYNWLIWKGEGSSFPQRLESNRLLIDLCLIIESKVAENEHIRNLFWANAGLQ